MATPCHLLGRSWTMLGHCGTRRPSQMAMRAHVRSSMVVYSVRLGIGMTSLMRLMFFHPKSQCDAARAAPANGSSLRWSELLSWDSDECLVDNGGCGDPLLYWVRTAAAHGHRATRDGQVVDSANNSASVGPTVCDPATGELAPAGPGIVQHPSPTLPQ